MVLSDNSLGNIFKSMDMDCYGIGLNFSDYLLTFNFTKEQLAFLETDGQDAQDELRYKRELVTFYVMGIGGMIACGLGLIGNILALIVLTQKSMRSSTYSYLSALAISDILVLLSTAFILSKDTQLPHHNQNTHCGEYSFYAQMFPYMHPMAFTMQVNSIWLTLAFTVDRYIMICHPFKAEPLCKVSRARKVVVGIYISAIIFNIPKWFEYRTNFNSIDLTDFGRTRVFKMLYHQWFYIAFVCGVPFIALFILNSFLMRAVHLSRKKGREINAETQRRNDTTIMLISVVIVFFCCQMPALVSRTIYALSDDLVGMYSRLLPHCMNEISNFLVILNSSINIVPYYFFGKRFRKTFWDLFCQCFLDKAVYIRKWSRPSLDLSLHTDRLRRGNSLASQEKSIDFNRKASSHNTVAPPLHGEVHEMKLCDEKDEDHLSGLDEAMSVKHNPSVGIPDTIIKHPASISCPEEKENVPALNELNAKAGFGKEKRCILECETCNQDDCDCLPNVIVNDAYIDKELINHHVTDQLLGTS